MDDHQTPMNRIMHLLIFFYSTFYFVLEYSQLTVLEYSQSPYDYTVEVTDRFKGLAMIDRVPEKLWAEVPDVV